MKQSLLNSNKRNNGSHYTAAANAVHVTGNNSASAIQDNRPAISGSSKKDVATTLLKAKSPVQRVQFFEAANRAPLNQIRDYEAGTKGNRPLIDARKLRDFEKVQDILQDDRAVSMHMTTLHHAINNARTGKGSSLTHRQALLTILRGAERRQGYDADEGIINADDGTAEGAQKLTEFGKAGKAFQDFGVDAVQHGPDTHRIQQYILYQENERRKSADPGEGTNTAFEHKDGALGVYRDMANYRYGVHTNDYQLNQHSPGRPGRNKIYAWDMLLDRVNGKQGVDVIDRHSPTQQPLQPDAGYPIHLMERMRLGHFGTNIQNAANEGRTAQDTHINNLDRTKMIKKGGTTLLGGLGAAAAALAFGAGGWPLLLTAGAGALGGYLFGKKRWK